MVLVVTRPKFLDLISLAVVLILSEEKGGTMSCIHSQPCSRRVFDIVVCNAGLVSPPHTLYCTHLKGRLFLGRLKTMRRDEWSVATQKNRSEYHAFVQQCKVSVTLTLAWKPGTYSTYTALGNGTCDTRGIVVFVLHAYSNERFREHRMRSNESLQSYGTCESHLERYNPKSHVSMDTIKLTSTRNPRKLIGLLQRAAPKSEQSLPTRTGRFDPAADHDHQTRPNQGLEAIMSRRDSLGSGCRGRGAAEETTSRAARMHVGLVPGRMSRGGTCPLAAAPSPAKPAAPAPMLPAGQKAVRGCGQNRPFRAAFSAIPHANPRPRFGGGSVFALPLPLVAP